MDTIINSKKTLAWLAVAVIFSSMAVLYFASAQEATSPSLSVSPATLSFSGTAGGSDPLAQTLTVSNTGTGTLSWTVSDDAAWLSSTPTSGESNNATITATVSLTGLAAGTYNATVTVSAAGASNSPKIVPVSLVVTAPTPTPVGRVKSSIEVNPNGKTQLRNAKVLSVSHTALSVKIWGLTFTVDTREATKFHARGGRIELSDIKTDHHVDVRGEINEETGVIMAREIKDNSITASGDDLIRETRISDLLKKIEELKKMLQELKEGRGRDR